MKPEIANHGQWFALPDGAVTLICCDCGLAHFIIWKPTPADFQMRFDREQEMTDIGREDRVLGVMPLYDELVRLREENLELRRTVMSSIRISNPETMMTGAGKVYRGTAEDIQKAGSVQVCEGDKVIRDLNPRHDLRNHSPDGFGWGYGGSGPAQLALAMLADATQGDELAQRLYQNFKFGVIAHLPDGDWSIPATDVLTWVASSR